MLASYFEFKELVAEVLVLIIVSVSYWEGVNYAH